MSSVIQSNNKIVQQLLDDLTIDEKAAIVAEQGNYISSTNPHVASVLVKMENFRPTDRLVFDVPSQEAIMRRVFKCLVEGVVTDVNPISDYGSVIEKVKHQAQKEVGPEAVASKSDAYGNALFNGLTEIGYDGMDETNKRAADVGRQGGTKAAVEYMFESSGMDYARMRSMYG